MRERTIPEKYDRAPTAEELAAAPAALHELAELEARPFQYGYPTRPHHGYVLPVPELEGDVTITPTDGRHAHISTPSGQRNVYMHRGRPYHVHFSQHIYRHPDGAWSFDHPDDGERYAGKMYGADDLPPGAVQPLRDAIGRAAGAWLETHPAELEEADRAALNNAAMNREELARPLARALVIVLAELAAIDAGREAAPRY